LKISASGVLRNLLVDEKYWRPLPGGNSMPEVYIHMVEGRTKDQKRALIEDITQSVVNRLNVDAASVMIQIIESSRDNKAKGGVLFSERT
jgi:4-oxalocrotonate tautomerase